MRQFPQSLSSRLLIALTLISLISVLGLGIAAYSSQRGALTNEIQTRLNTIARLKEEQLVRWLDDRNADLNVLAQNNTFREHIMMIASQEASSSDKYEYSYFLRDSLSTVLKNRPSYTRIEILTATGNVIASTDLGRPLGAATNDDFFQRAFASPAGKVISDIHRNPETGLVELTFGRVVMEETATVGNRDPIRIGAIIVDVELESSFFPLLNSWPDRGTSGEIILGRDDGDKLFVLNSLRNLPSSEPNLAFGKNSEDPSPLYKAILGMDGVGPAEGEHGERVISAYRPVSDTGWGLVVQMDQSEAYQNIQRITRRLLLLAVITFFVAWLSAYIIWNRMATPLSNLIDATQEVIGDNYSVEIEVTHDDEIGMLTESFKQMVETLDRRKKELQMANRVVNDTALTNTRLVAQLRGLNSELEAKVYERTKELSEANEKLTHLDQLKSKFISNVSHELRNPVASLKLYLRLLEKSNDQNRERYIAGIGNQIDWLSKLIETILDITQLERGINEMEIDHVDLSTIVRQIIHIYTPIAEDANLTLVSALPTHPVFVSGSENKLTQMLTNLLANAVNYTSEGEITIELYATKDNAILSVEDTGIGIDEEDLPHLFERFYRGKNTHELEIRGTGLGLGIVKEIVDLHQGHMEVESQLGIGSRFLLHLPLSHPIGQRRKSQEPCHRTNVNERAPMITVWSTDEEAIDRHPE